ncbi:MAG: ATP-binding protein [Cytophagales bacterium]|nr:MAG: ATP-binding protein [Cytophagales bacterium]
MQIQFDGKYKSLKSFLWQDIPKLVVLTGPNGTGKSQLIELVHNTIINKQYTTERVSVIGEIIKPEEVVFLRDWQLNNVGYVNLSSIQQQTDSHYNNFVSGQYANGYEHQLKFNAISRKIVTETGRSGQQVSREEFGRYFEPQLIIEQEAQLSQKISEIFYSYRIDEIELQAKKEDDKSIEKKIGQKPWLVLREILKEAKIPFDINDPENISIREGFQLRLTHQVSREEVQFNDLSSGEKVLISLVFYLYNSQEKKIYPKLFLMDEPDAHLHPSMSQQFINVVKNVLVDKLDVRVIMTTHSPSTVILTPVESLYEMAIVEPRIRKVTSKNQVVSLLTSGLVYVGEGTKYFLVEDNDDVEFYSHVHNQLISTGIIDNNIPLVFIPASTKDKSGGKYVVQNWVKKLSESGLAGVIRGLIDEDVDNNETDEILKINRYSIENYLADPIVIYATLLDKEVAPEVEGLQLMLGEEYKLKQMPPDLLQKIANTIIALVEHNLTTYFNDVRPDDLVRVEVSFSNGIKLEYPNWLLKKRGKTILNQLYGDAFKNPIVNFTSVFKAFRKLNLFPKELVDKYTEMKNFRPIS